MFWYLSQVLLHLQNTAVAIRKSNPPSWTVNGIGISFYCEHYWFSGWHSTNNDFIIILCFPKIVSLNSRIDYAQGRLISLTTRRGVCLLDNDGDSGSDVDDND